MTVDLLDTLHFDDLDSETQASIHVAIGAARSENARVAFTHRSTEVSAWPIYRYGTGQISMGWGVSSARSGRVIAQGVRS